MRTIPHSKGEPCPLCEEPRFCDDCGICHGCGFRAPDVEGPHPPPPAPKIPCPLCGNQGAHHRTCPKTQKKAKPARDFPEGAT